MFVKGLFGPLLLRLYILLGSSLNANPAVSRIETVEKIRFFCVCMWMVPTGSSFLCLSCFVFGCQFYWRESFCV